MRRLSDFFLSLKGLIVAGLIIRVSVALFTETDDLRVWRGISIYAYVYGLDIFSIYRGYGPMINVTYLAVYPIYLVISLVFPSQNIERLILKSPMILGDILIGLILYKIVREFGEERQAKIIAGSWILNPYVIWISSIWGMFDVLPTLFTLFAMERFLSKHYKFSAISLAISVLYKLYSIFLVPWFLFAVYKEGKEQTFVYLEYFLVGIAILILPWKIVLSDFTMIMQQGATGELVSPTLSYFPAFISWNPIFTDYWTYISSAISLALVIGYMYYHRNTPNSLESLNSEILLGVLLIFLGPHRFVYPTHLIWALPFVLIATLYARKLPLSLIIFLMVTPVLWILNWDVTKWFTSGAAESFDINWPLYNEPVNFAHGVNFSLLCLLCVFYLVQSKNVKSMSRAKFWIKNKFYEQKNLIKITRSIGLYLPIIFVLLVYIRDWIHVTLWKSYYYKTFSHFVKTTPLFFPIVVFFLILLSYIHFLWEMIFRRSISFRNTRNQLDTIKKKAIPLLVATIWAYCLGIFLNMPNVSLIYAIFALYIPRIIIEVIWYQKSSVHLIWFMSFIITDYAVFRHFGLSYAGIWNANNFWFQVDLLFILMAIIPLLLFTCILDKSDRDGEIS